MPKRMRNKKSARGGKKAEGEGASGDLANVPPPGDGVVASDVWGKREHQLRNLLKTTLKRLKTQPSKDGKEHKTANQALNRDLRNYTDETWCAPLDESKVRAL